MANILSNEQIKFYHNKGFLFPFDLYNPEEAKNFHSLYNKIEEDLGYEPQKEFRIKAHLPFPWLCDIVNNSRLLDAVEDLIGPNVLCWGASFFAKAAKTTGSTMLIFSDASDSGQRTSSTQYGKERAALDVEHQSRGRNSTGEHPPVP